MAALRFASYLLLAANVVIFFIVASIYLNANPSHVPNPGGSTSAVTLLTLFSGAVVISLVGFYSALTSKPLLLVLSHLGLASVLLLTFKAVLLRGVWKTERFQEQLKDVYDVWIPLSAQPKGVQEFVQEMERSGPCCGLFRGPSDWGDAALVPESCRCVETTGRCVVLEGRVVYSTPCVPFLLLWMDGMLASELEFGFLLVILLLLGICLPAFILYSVKGQPPGEALEIKLD